MYRQYTSCFPYPDGTGRPFNVRDLVILGLTCAAIGAALAVPIGAVVGILIGGKLGALIGAGVGCFCGVYVAMSIAISEASARWLDHRLVCLGGDVCAIGTVSTEPGDAGVGALDNDECFDLLPMPYPGSDEWRFTNGSDHYAQSPPVPGIVDPLVQGFLDDHPNNDVLVGNRQGLRLIRPVAPLEGDLGYDTSHNWLHCEVEGDFWVRMATLATALAALGGLLSVATVAAIAGGAFAGAAAGSAIGSSFVGVVGGILGALLAGVASVAVGFLIIRSALTGVYAAAPEHVEEDANVGDHERGPIRKGDKVVVYGTHVYDGFHEGWHEIHPLKSVIRIAELPHGESDYTAYLEWNPEFDESRDRLPADLPDMPSELTELTADEMRAGITAENARFARRAQWLEERWCRLVHERFDEATLAEQRTSAQRWTIHPEVDGGEPNH